MKKLALLLCILFVSVVATCQNIKMKIASITPADGENVVALEFSDTLSSSLGSGSGAGSGSGVPRFEFIKIKKLNGLSTNELFKRTLNGTTIPEVDFEYYDASNVMFYKIVLKGVLLTHFSYLTPECSNCSSLSHQVWFDFTSIEVTDVASGNVLKYNRSTRVIN